MKSKILYYLIFIFAFKSFGQLKDSTQIEILPKWELNDFSKVKIKILEREVVNKKANNSIVMFYANYKVVEKNIEGYILCWTMNNFELKEGQLSKRQVVLSKLLNQEILIKFSTYGEYVEVLNFEQIILNANKIIDGFLGKKLSTNEKLSWQILKETIASKYGVESELLQIIRNYFVPFGHKYPLNVEMNYDLKYPNIFNGKEPFDAIEKVKLSILEANKNIYLIDSNQVIDAKQISSDLILMLKSKLNYNQKEISSIVNKYNVGINENKKYYLDSVKGQLQKLIIKRRTNLIFMDTDFEYTYTTMI